MAGDPTPESTDRVEYAEEGPVGRFVRFTRHPIRAAAMGMAAFALAWGIAVTEGLVAAIVGAVSGVVIGEVLGRSRWRLPLLLGVVTAFALISWGLAAMCTGSEAIPSLVGPGSALVLSGVLRYGSLALALTIGFRMVAVRKPAAMALELAFVVLAIAVMFAAHREGVIARPLWISDWAWQKGIDPADIFMTVGASAAVVLAVLMVLETKGGRSVSTLIALPALALLAVACLDMVGRPTPQVDDGIGLTEDDPGDPPDYDPPDSEENGGNEQGGDGGQGQSGRGDGGGASGQDGERDGGASGGQRDGGAGGGEGDGGESSGVTDGGYGGGGDAAADGGGASGSGDASVDGGGASGAGADGGSSGGSSDAGPDAGMGGMPDAGLTPPPSDTGESSGPPQTAQEQLEQQDQGPQNSPAPMAVVVLESDYSSPSQTYYFRQGAWSDFNGTRMVPSELDGSDPDTLDEFPTRRTTVTPPPPSDRMAVRARVAMLVEHQQPFALESPVTFTPIPNPNADRFVRAYRFESLAQITDYQELLGRESGDPDWSEEIAEQYLETHPDPQFAELTEQILADLPEHVQDDPFARALAIKLWLDRELIYSTRHRHADAADPTVDFLFGNRIGYCTHFAHSAVLLWREAGVPSRIATGYAVGEENRRGGSSILIRSGDAHAWPELYLQGIGWVVLDIAAERNLDEPGQPLDEDLQRMLGEMAREQPPDPEDEIEDEEEDEGEFPLAFWHLLLILAGLVLVSLYGVKLVRRVAPLFASRTGLPRTGYRAMLDRLAEVGLARDFGETRESFAGRVESVAPAFSELTALHVAARLRNPDAPEASRPEHSPPKWREVARKVRRELRKGTPLWRRLVGLLHPVSFFDSR